MFAVVLLVIQVRVKESCSFACIFLHPFVLFLKLFEMELSGLVRSTGPQDQSWHLYESDTIFSSCRDIDFLGSLT